MSNGDLTGFLWTTDGDFALTYQGQLGEGGAGMVYQVTRFKCEED